MSHCSYCGDSMFDTPVKKRNINYYPCIRYSVIMTRAGASVRNVRKIVTLDLTAVMCYIHEPCNNHNRVREKKTKINSID